MALIKTLKDKAYCKRYQTKWRRRREGKTDYYARRRLIAQDKRKYNSPKYRMVVRFTNRDIISQIVAARIVGDEVICSAYSHELPRYGIKCGLTNFSAAYATGLLLARRLLSQFGMAEVYVGKEEADGEFYEVEAEENRRPFKAILDVGLVRTTTGNKVFAAMKGAVDGGMNIPHNEKRFPAYNEEDGFNPETLKHRILGGHVSDYMAMLKDENPEKYEKHFSSFIKEGITPENIEAMYKEAHKKIREDPSFTKKPKQQVEHKRWNQQKITLEQRKQNVMDKIAAAIEKTET